MLLLRRSGTVRIFHAVPGGGGGCKTLSTVTNWKEDSNVTTEVNSTQDLSSLLSPAPTRTQKSVRAGGAPGARFGN